MTAGERPRVSVIIPAKNAESELRRLFEGLHGQTAAPGTFEVLIADDGSTDATRDVIAGEPLAQLVELPAAIGPYPARNVAAARARGDLLAFTDADVIPADDWIERGIREFDASEVDLIAGGIRIPLGERPTATAMVDAARHLNQERNASRGHGVTANMWVRKTVFDEIGGFNEHILSGGDSEFGQRAGAAGKKLVYAPDARVDHPPRVSPRELIRKGYRIGIGSAQQKVHAGGPRPTWQRPRAYLPNRRLMGIHRLEASGHKPGPLKHLQLLLTEHLFLTVPVIVGSVVGTIRERQKGRPS